MLRIDKKLPDNHGLASVMLRRAAVLTLPYDQRCRSRLAVQLDDGCEAAIFLPRGTVLRDGSVLVATDGSLVRVVAAGQPVMRVTSPDRLTLMRAAYHLGNRHTPVQVAADWLQLEFDPVLRDMLLRLGVQVEEVQAAFDPENGAYGGGHRHGHDETFAEDQAVAQEVFRHRHGADHDEASEDAGDHVHSHDHSHSHSHAHAHVHSDACRHDPAGGAGHEGNGNACGHDHAHTHHRP